MHKKKKSNNLQSNSIRDFDKNKEKWVIPCRDPLEGRKVGDEERENGKEVRERENSCGD